MSHRNTAVYLAVLAGMGVAGGTAQSAAAQGQRAAGALEEIVVTAQRREQNLQDVPISVTALSADDMQLRNIENVKDLNMLLPNVTIRGGGTSGGSTGQFVIRGIPGVARYIDGVAQPHSQGALVDVLELQRVEVLRGPQGTLFGKNAMGGAIQYVTQKPADTFGARIRATMGNFNRRDVIANVDVPLTDTLLTKVTAARMRRDGYVQSAVSGVKYGDEDTTVLRGQLAWLPTDTFRADLAVTSTQRTPNFQQANVLYDVIENQGAVLAYNAAGLVFTDASDAFGKLKEYRTTSTYTGPGDIWNAKDFSLNLNWNISDTLTFVSISGGRKFDWANYQDLDASHYAFFNQYQYQEGKEGSQEFQLQGNMPRLNWTVGLYWGMEESDVRFIRWQYEEINPRPRNQLTYTKRVDKAVFGEVTYDLTDQLSVTAGLRYSREEFNNADYQAAEPRPPFEQITTNLDRAGLNQANAANFGSWTPRLSVQYNWTDNVMTYVTYSEGFNGGGVNGTPIDGVFIPYTGEKLHQYEVGLRSDLLNNSLRFNAAYFYGNWDKIQVGEVIVPGTITTQNAGKAEVQGIEIDSAWAVTDNFQVNLSGGWLDTKYTDVGNTHTIALNSKFALAPDYSYSVGASYNWDLSNGASMTLRGDWGWVSDFVTIQDIRLQKTQDAYGLLSGRLVYTEPGDKWDIALYGTNLTDKWYQLGGFSATLGGVDQGVVARPREYGLTLNLRF